MLESLKEILKERFPYIVDLHAALVRGRAHAIDAYYSRRPFSPGNIRPTPYGFKLGGGNSVQHKAMQEGRFEPEEVVLMQRILNQRMSSWTSVRISDFMPAWPGARGNRCSPWNRKRGI